MADSTLPPLSEPFALPESACVELQTHGHVTVRGLLSRAEAIAYRGVIHRARSRVAALVPTDEEGDAYARAFAQHMNLWRVDADAARFSLAPRFARVAAQLLSAAKVRIYHDQALFKAAGGGPTPWHQDKHYWPIDTDLLTMWMPLVDVMPEMGELRCARGTHRAGPLSDKPISAQSNAELEALVRARGYALAGTGPMRAGDASFHLAWTLHGAGPNRTAQEREVMTVIWLPDGARVTEPRNSGQAADLATWLPRLRPGDLAASLMNPVCD